MRWTSSLIATVGATLLIPAAAHAATLSYTADNTLVYTADAGVKDSPMIGKDDSS